MPFASPQVTTDLWPNDHQPVKPALAGLVASAAFLMYTLDARARRQPLRRFLVWHGQAHLCYDLLFSSNPCRTVVPAYSICTSTRAPLRTISTLSGGELGSATCRRPARIAAKYRSRALIRPSLHCPSSRRSWGNASATLPYPPQSTAHAYCTPCRGCALHRSAAIPTLPRRCQ